MIQFVKKKRKNDSKLDDFLYISVNELERFKSLPSMTESLPGSKIAKHKSPRAKERASGSRARSKIRPADKLRSSAAGFIGISPCDNL